MENFCSPSQKLRKLTVRWPTKVTSSSKEASRIRACSCRNIWLLGDEIGKHNFFYHIRMFRHILNRNRRYNPGSRKFWWGRRWCWWDCERDPWNSNTGCIQELERNALGLNKSALRDAKNQRSTVLYSSLSSLFNVLSHILSHICPIVFQCFSLFCPLFCPTFCPTLLNVYTFLYRCISFSATFDEVGDKTMKASNFWTAPQIYRGQSMGQMWDRIKKL